MATHTPSRPANPTSNSYAHPPAHPTPPVLPNRSRSTSEQQRTSGWSPHAEPPHSPEANPGHSGGEGVVARRDEHDFAYERQEDRHRDDRHAHEHREDRHRDSRHGYEHHEDRHGQHHDSHHDNYHDNHHDRYERHPSPPSQRPPQAGNRKKVSDFHRPARRQSSLQQRSHQTMNSQEQRRSTRPRRQDSYDRPRRQDSYDRPRRQDSYDHPRRQDSYGRPQRQLTQHGHDYDGHEQGGGSSSRRRPTQTALSRASTFTLGPRRSSTMRPATRRRPRVRTGLNEDRAQSRRETWVNLRDRGVSFAKHAAPEIAENVLISIATSLIGMGIKAAKTKYGL